MGGENFGTGGKEVDGTTNLPDLDEISRILFFFYINLCRRWGAG